MGGKSDLATEEWEWLSQFFQFDGGDDAQGDEQRDGTIFGAVLGYMEPMEQWNTIVHGGTL